MLKLVTKLNEELREEMDYGLNREKNMKLIVVDHNYNYRREKYRSSHYLSDGRQIVIISFNTNREKHLIVYCIRSMKSYN